MDKRALQAYAVWAKQNLENQIEVSLKALSINSDRDIKQARKVGEYTIIDGDSNSYPADLYEKRNSITNLIKNEGYKNVIEEFAYTWFNRIIALRFMEVHDFLPHGFRVLSSRDRSFEPEILKNLNYVQADLKLDMNVIASLHSQGKIEEVYRYVLFRQCNALSEILPMLFSNENSYLELLLPKALLKGETIITKLLEIDESSFLEDVEVIGWLYQFYVADDRQAFRDAKVVTKDLIPTLTQIFTPDWIVRYMTENSLGRLWLESYPSSGIKSDMRYYVEDAKQEPEVQKKLNEIKYRNVNPEDIKIIEPCCGSGHILVYIFDLLYKMYDEKGYQQREIPTLILSKNIYGLEIDKRATQLATFSLIMKARKANNRFFNKNYYVEPNVVEIWDSRLFIGMDYKSQMTDLKLFTNDEIKATSELIETFRYGKTIGSLSMMPKLNISLVESVIEKLNSQAVVTIFNDMFVNEGSKLLKILVKQYKIMADKYDIMITNPPYLGISKMEANPKQYLIAKYPSSKSDMFAMFMEVPFVKKNGFRAMVNPDSWMFLVSYEDMRKKIIHNESIVNMIHLGLGAFDATVQTTSFVIRNSPLAGNGVYFRLVDEKDKESAFLSGGGITTNLEAFKAIPGCPLAYWINDKMIFSFKKGVKLEDVAIVRNGLKTGDNNQFVRLWFEVSQDNSLMYATDYIQAMYSGKTWFPYNKGGEFRKWYGNNEYVVNWKDKGKKVIHEAKKDKRNVQDYPDSFKFLPIITWSLITSYKPSFRFKKYAISDICGMSLYQVKEEDINYYLGFVNSCVSLEILGMFNPTLNFQAGDIGRLPMVKDEAKKEKVEQLVEHNTKCSIEDWDSFETSWDFKKHPLI